MRTKTRLALGVLASMAAGVATAQTPFTIGKDGSSITLYGNLDYYLNVMRSTSGAQSIALQDGAYLRSRWGLRGNKDFGDGYSARFVAEQGLNGTTGAAADATRMFDRQLWAGLVTPVGEVRTGRQNTAILYVGGAIDYTALTLGSVVNAFGVPSRYDSDLAYLTPRMAGFQFEAHYSLQGSAVDNTTNQGVYQAALDYQKGPFRAGYAGIAGKAPVGAVVDTRVVYHNYYVNYDYGRGKVYVVYVRSNNNSTTAGTGGTLNNGGSPLNNVGNSLVAGTDAGANTYYDIYQASVDFMLHPKVRIGALYGQIKDDSGTGKNASGYSFGTFWEAFKDVTFYVLGDALDNDPNAGFRPSGSAGLTKTFTAPADVNGQTIRGAHFGVLYRF
jgi:predicted porin